MEFTEPTATDWQHRVIELALSRCTFAWQDVAPGRVIPVEWADLSRYATLLESKAATGGHLHVHHESGDTGHPITTTGVTLTPDPDRPSGQRIVARSRVLGLAWYSGRITMDLSLTEDPELAAEVFLSEAAHMLDFFWFTDRERMVVWNALHPAAEDLPLDTPVVEEGGVPIAGTEGWFDVGPYRSWVGEAWMGLFVRAYSDVPVTIGFDRHPTDVAVFYTRGQLTPWFTSASGKLHDTHARIRPVAYHPAQADGRPSIGYPRCAVCKP